MSKPTEVRYTTLHLLCCNWSRAWPARQNIIGEFDERSLVNYYTGSPTVHARASARARARTVGAEKRKLRIPEVHQQRSRSPGRFSFLFLSFLSSFFFLTFFSRTEEARCRAKKVGTSPRPTGVGIPRLWVGIHKIFVRRLTTTRVFRARKIYPGRNVLSICLILAP